MPFDLVEVLYNGRVMAERQASGDRQAALLETGFTLKEPGWLAARCRGGTHLPDGQLVFAHTSPVWFHPDGKPPRPAGEPAARLLALLDHTMVWAERSARYDNPKSHEHLVTMLEAARRVLMQ
jgi:hypothetical protein